MILRLCALIASAFFLFSCSATKENSGSVSSSSNTIKKKGFDKYLGDHRSEVDPNTGETRIKTGKSELYKGQESSFAKGNANAKKQFATGEFDSRRWQGAKDKDLNKWNGNKDFQYSPEFVRQNSQYASKQAREGTSRFSEGENIYDTYAARQSGKKVTYGTDYRTERRREVFAQPRIIDKSEQAPSGRTVDDVKGLLGQ